MRKLSLFGGLVLSLVAATSVFAASPATQAASAAGHKWTTSYRDGAVSVSSTLRANSTYASVRLSVRLDGAKKGEKIRIVFFDRSGGKTDYLASRTVLITNAKGTFAATWSLSKADRMALKKLPSSAQRDLRLTANGATATGIFVGK